MISIRKIFRKQQGQTMVEFALVLPVLALLLLGIIQFGVIFNHYLAVTDAVRAGARQGAVARHLPGDPCDAVVAKVQDAAGDLPGTLTVACSVDPGWEPGADVTVTASYPYEINLLGVVVQSGDVSSTTTERVE